jgi:catechol-2,3-dioxygenase
MNAPRIAFSHVGLYVRDLERMAGFYSRFLEMTETDRGEYDMPTGRARFIFLSTDPRDHHQLVLATGRPEGESYNVLNQISFRLESFALLRDRHRRLANEPVSEVRPICHGNAVSVYFRDPEGNRVEMFFDTPWYVNQPMILMSLPDDQLWQWVEKTARSLPGFRPVEEWREEVAARMTRQRAMV